jgi:hypothetical protein
MSLISYKDVNKFDVKLVENGNSQDFQLNSKAALAPKHEDLTVLAASIQTGDSHIVSCAHGKLLQIANQIKRLQQEAQVVLEKANMDHELSHAACNFEKVPGKVYHLYKKTKNDSKYWSMLSLDDYRGRPPAGSEYLGAYKLESDRSFSPLSKEKSADQAEMEELINQMLRSPNKAIGFEAKNFMPS